MAIDAPIASATRSGTTVEAFGLVREPTPVSGSRFEFIEPYLEPRPRNWQGYAVTLPTEIIPEHSMLNFYAISLRHQTYITICVSLTDGEKIDSPRRIEMKYRDMILDNVRHAGGDMKTMRFLGTESIVNDPARNAIEAAFARAGEDVVTRGHIELAPDSAELYTAVVTNPLARGLHGLLLENREVTGHASIKRLIYMSEGCEPKDKDEFAPKMHMVIELCRPGPGEPSSEDKASDESQASAATEGEPNHTT